MKKLYFLSILALFACRLATAQQDKTFFATMEAELRGFRPDTSAVPNDRITKKIEELRQLRGGFDIEHAMQYKFAEAKDKGDISEQQADQLVAYFTNGAGYRQLQNAVTWLYRREFSYRELKKMVRFYKTAAGQKMASRFPFVMLKSIAIMEMLTKQMGASK